MYFLVFFTADILTNANLNNTRTLKLKDLNKIELLLMHCFLLTNVKRSAVGKKILLINY